MPIEATRLQTNVDVSILQTRTDGHAEIAVRILCLLQIPSCSEDTQPVRQQQRIHCGNSVIATRSYALQTTLVLQQAKKLYGHKRGAQLLRHARKAAQIPSLAHHREIC